MAVAERATAAGPDETLDRITPGEQIDMGVTEEEPVLWSAS